METIPGKKAAVLVIDVQKGFFMTDPPPLDAANVVSRINQLIARIRSAGGHVFFIQHDGTSEESAEPFTEGWKPHPELKLLSGDKTIRKTTCDAFYRTPLDVELHARRVTTVVLAGYATEFCIDATLRGALSRDLKVVVAADAHTTNDSPILSAELIRKHQNWVWESCTAHHPVRVAPEAQITFA